MIETSGWVCARNLIGGSEAQALRVSAGWLDGSAGWRDNLARAKLLNLPFQMIGLGMIRSPGTILFDILIEMTKAGQRFAA